MDRQQRRDRAPEVAASGSGASAVGASAVGASAVGVPAVGVSAVGVPAARRRSFTRPAKPGFCWVAVQLHGREVDRPGLVARWASTPEGWRALVAWSGLDGEVRVEWMVEERLTPVRPERAP